MASKLRKRVTKDGTITWTCIVDAPAGPDGKRRQKRLSAPTRDKLAELLTRTMREIHTGTYIEPTETTIGEYLDEWLTSAAATVRPATAYIYRHIIDHRIKPHLGGIPLMKLTAMHIQGYYTARRKVGDQASTTRLDHAVLRRALKQAVRWRLIARNPCDDADPPRPARPETHTWTAEQARTFLTGTVDDDLAALWRLALATGMRRGELLALRWADIDFDRRALAVTRTMTTTAEGQWTTGEPKSAAGRRSIALDAATVAVLKRHQRRQTERMMERRDIWQMTDVVFDRGDGRPFHPNAMHARFAAVATPLGLPRIRFHDLRHTAATLMLEQGVHPKIVQERLGHSTIAMTLDRYSHVSMSMQQEAADRLERLFGG